MRIVFLVAAITTLISCASTRYCVEVPPPAPPADPEVVALSPGRFAIEFRATGGTSKGHQVAGELTLIPLDPIVRPDGHALYGWLSADLGVVDAPLCLSDGPSPMSHDPLNPGVLVTTGQDGRQFLTVAHAGHKYQPGWGTMDGCGIILHIDQADVSSFSGRWGGYGGLYNGCGTFQAVRSDL